MNIVVKREKDNSHSLNAFERQLIGSLMAVSNVKIILELGVYKGATSKFICEWSEANGIKAELYGFDLKEMTDDLIQNDAEIRALVQAKKMTLIPGSLPQSLDRFFESHNLKVDVAIIDAKHDYESVFGELSRIWPFLNTNGFIICHDYHKQRIQYAVEHFSRKSGAKFLPVLSDNPSAPVYSSLVVLSKPKLDYRYFYWFIYHFQLKKSRGYYFLKRIFRKYFEKIN